uniref:Uncharacterized protein n=1 Tax=Romanomermis culicivorax TaxID=13658 RepID=A0A915KMK0_ROMCU
MVKTVIKWPRRPRWLHFRVGLVEENGSLGGSDFGFRCIEDTAGFGNGVGQLLDIPKTFRLFPDC